MSNVAFKTIGLKRLLNNDLLSEITHDFHHQ